MFYKMFRGGAKETFEDVETLEPRKARGENQIFDHHDKKFPVKKSQEKKIIALDDFCDQMATLDPYARRRVIPCRYHVY